MNIHYQVLILRNKFPTSSGPPAIWQLNESDKYHHGCLFFRYVSCCPVNRTWYKENERVALTSDVIWETIIQSNNIPGRNYAFLGWTLISERIYELHVHVHVCSSFQDGIK